MMVGVVVGAALLLMQSGETSRALNSTLEDTTAVVVLFGIDTIDAPLVISLPSLKPGSNPLKSGSQKSHIRLLLGTAVRLRRCPV